MSSTLSTTVATTVEQKSTHPPQHLVSSERPVARVRLTHRLALHLGLALITWSRRPSRTVASHEQRAQREAREREAERLLLLTLQRR